VKLLVRVLAQRQEEISALGLALGKVFAALVAEVYVPVLR
jgi:esterase/lipase